ncbi:hypothetical protein GGC65_000073 [Sphingopyxis sp. OAS728]|uniref:hypothetical protein n=1 Tax=Sphingopyxis sp. OAS728 TaxID=2663823 RepID=UPI0017895D85|nr:hypothetical protein [Sphingopyxis sp. OAS728]MBE1525617.1 hypothetical protein [Sphingopyxis sp. OAS728]
MVIGRRELLWMGAAGATLFASPATQACTIIPPEKAKPFRRGECERQIHDLIAFMNEAPSLSSDAVSEWVDARDVDVEFEYPVSENVGGGLYNYLFFREYRISGGKLDPDPIKIKEINLIRNVKNHASFQFTLTRNQFFPADDEGCNGLFTHGEYFKKTDTAFIARFFNNRLKSFRDFPEWFA